MDGDVSEAWSANVTTRARVSSNTPVLPRTNGAGLFAAASAARFPDLLTPTRLAFRRPFQST